MRTRFTVIGCSAWLFLILVKADQLQAFPVVYTYIGSSYDHGNTNAPCQPGFASNDHMSATVWLDSIYWGMAVDDPPGSGAIFSSGPYVGATRVRVTIDESGTMIGWSFFDAPNAGIDMASVGQPDGSGRDIIFGPRPACGREFYDAVVNYAAGPRAPGEGWTMEVAPTPTPEPSPLPTPAPSATPLNCVLGSGYWTNHPEAWCMETIRLAGVTYTQAEAIAIMRHSSGPDKTYSLAQAVISALLNRTCNLGIPPSPIISWCSTNVADNFLCHHPVGSGVRANSPEWRYIRDVYSDLMSFNSGTDGIPSCDN